ncbi:g3884 [Coccomyxa viridis]|uniref:G3884 protein n=1 Tax=Coccomyxa viridis TaxID=1274662 RepID=A0ABP1FVU0_9CHLO
MDVAQYSLLIANVFVILLHDSTASRESAFIGYSELKGKGCVLTTSYGQVRIEFLPHLAPETVAAVHDLASASRECQGCKFYRNEAAPTRGSLGPPYGLLQGSLQSLKLAPAAEGKTPAKRGQVCMIPGTKEFFIALVDHDEWGGAHTVWGEVSAADMDTTVMDIVGQRFHAVTHPEYGTVMRMLNTEVPFRIALTGYSGAF